MSYQLGTTSVGSLTYQYDAAGRRTQMGGSLAATGFPSPVSSATYDAANELTNWNGTTITPDANGNILNDGAAAYTWNGRNQLISRGSTSFQYDSYGRRTLNAAGNNLLYEGWNAGQELSGTTPVANRILGGVDEFFNRTDSTGAYSQITDALGSTLALTNSSGNITTQYGYYPYGNTTSYGGASTNASQYTGRENDLNGLYFYRARYYSPTFGRFISEDPIGFAGGINVYSYAYDDPIAFRDPSGQDVTVTIYPGVDGNPFGHAGISVNGSDPVGFNPASGYDGEAVVDVLLPLEFPVPGRVLPIKPDRVPSNTWTIPTTPDQDQAVLAYIKSRTDNGGLYHPWGRNCAQFVHSALQAGGIQSSSSPFPTDLYRSLAPDPNQPKPLRW
jgi:RHS repeat-associated protein